MTSYHGPQWQCWCQWARNKIQSSQPLFLWHLNCWRTHTLRPCSEQWNTPLWDMGWWTGWMLNMIARVQRLYRRIFTGKKKSLWLALHTPDTTTPNLAKIMWFGLLHFAYNTTNACACLCRLRLCACRPPPCLHTFDPSKEKKKKDCFMMLNKRCARVAP